MKTKHALLIALMPFAVFAIGLYAQVISRTNPPLFGITGTNSAPHYTFMDAFTGLTTKGTNWITDDFELHVQGREMVRLPGTEKLRTNLDPNMLTFKFTDASNRVWVPKWEMVK